MRERPGQEYNQDSVEKDQRLRYLVRVFENGLNDPDIVGYHGISLEVLESIAESGKIIGGYGGHFEEDIGKLPKQISIFLKNSKKIQPSRSVVWHLSDSPLSATVGYAEDQAIRHAVMRAANLDLGNREFSDIEFSGDLQDLMVKRGLLSKGKLKKILASRNRKQGRYGLILGLGKAVLEDFELRPQNEVDLPGEVAVLCPEGINYQYIKGLEPEGQKEWDYFIKLQKKVERKK